MKRLAVLRRTRRSCGGDHRAGRAFCAGGDLALLGKGRETGATKELEPLLRAACKWSEDAHHAATRNAAVNGAAAGGYERRARCGHTNRIRRGDVWPKLCQSRLVS